MTIVTYSKTTKTIGRALSVLTLLSNTSRTAVLVDAYFCPDNCEPFGKCVSGECHCHPGFDGMDCSFPYVYCPDGITTCYNGATCKAVSTHPDQMTGNIKYECDCSTAYGLSFVEGSQCEHPQSEVCEESGINDVVKKSEYAFCTNGGTCKKYVKKGENHAGCVCDNTNFEGRHCQYEKGRAPKEELRIANRNGDGSKSSIKVKHTGITKFIKFLIVVIVGGVIGYFVTITYRNYIIDTQCQDHVRVEETLRDLKLTASTDDMDDINETGLNDNENMAASPRNYNNDANDDDEWNLDDTAVKAGTLT